MDCIRITLFVFFVRLLMVCTLHAYVSVGSEAPNFVAHDINGQEVSLEKYKGRVVVCWSGRTTVART